MNRIKMKKYTDRERIYLQYFNFCNVQLILFFYFNLQCLIFTMYES